MSTLAFSAVVGQDDAKLALLLAAAQPRLGGVLLRGQKGSAKTTLARGLAALLPGDAPFVELPVGATEDRVVGSIDVTELLTGGTTRVRPGLLAAADGGVLYVDEINLLADHLVDVLLDVAVTGVNRIERDGVSHTHPARFVLIGSMNPEEGDLRPQLLDRFGLAVDVTAPVDAAARVTIVRRQLALENTGAVRVFDDDDAVLRARLAGVVPAGLPDEVVLAATRVALAVAAEGLRADLMLCRAAVALAGWDGRAEATVDDLRRVAPFVLAHRSRRTPFDDHGLSDSDLDDAFDQATQPPPPPPDAEEPDVAGNGDGGADDEDVVAPARESAPPPMWGRATDGAPPPGRRSTAMGPTGRYLRDRPMPETGGPVAVVPTAINVAGRRAADPTVTAQPTDLREAVREQRTGNLIVIAVDTSGSMGAEQRIAAAKGAVLGLLTDAYQRRDRVALIAFRGERADTVLRPTASVELARVRLAELPTGGTTPLAAALDAALAVAAGASGDQALDPLIVVITDGRATFGGPDPMAGALVAAGHIARAAIPSVVLDAERGPRLGLARGLAAAMGADYVALDGLDGDRLVEATIRKRLAAANPNGRPPQAQ